MKKYICAIMLAMLVLLCACGESAEVPEETPELVMPTPEPTPTPTPEPTYAPFSPEEMHDLVSATCELNGEKITTDDEDAVRSLNWLLGKVALSENAGAIKDTSVITVLRSDGEEYCLELANDNSGEMMADGVRYCYDDPGRTELFSLFYYRDIHDRMVKGGSEDYILENITRIDWRRYAAAYGEEETNALIDLFGEWVLNGDGPEHYRELFDSTRGIENNYLERYAYYVTEAYELHKQDFCQMALFEVSEESYYRIVDMLCSYWATSRDHLWTRFSTAARTGY